MENGFKIYHMGDTGLFGDMKLIADYYKPDLILMPIGGHFVMDPQDAAYATKSGSNRSSSSPCTTGRSRCSRGRRRST